MVTMPFCPVQTTFPSLPPDKQVGDHFKNERTPMAASLKGRQRTKWVRAEARAHLISETPGALRRPLRLLGFVFKMTHYRQTGWLATRWIWQYGNGMVAVKVTFTLDEKTITRLNEAAQRLSMPKSEVVREAIQEYHSRMGKLSDAERRRMLEAFDRLVPAIPGRSAAEVDRELADLRKARRSGGRKSRKGRCP